MDKRGSGDGGRGDRGGRVEGGRDGGRCAWAGGKFFRKNGNFGGGNFGGGGEGFGAGRGRGDFGNAVNFGNYGSYFAGGGHGNFNQGAGGSCNAVNFGGAGSNFYQGGSSMGGAHFGGGAGTGSDRNFNGDKFDSFGQNYQGSQSGFGPMEGDQQHMDRGGGPYTAGVYNASGILTRCTGGGGGRGGGGA